jgi:hypothetical protein
MSFQVSLLLEAPVTLFTLVRLFAAVHKLMPSQISPLVEIAVAFIAFVTPFLALLVRIRVFDPGIRDEYRVRVDDILRVVNALLIGMHCWGMMT